ncbi:hypothetical protein ACFQVD_44450 [Streptosporangium amethystogenes subsp. fukuiense]|uniref:Uncharacterized protein n=1 Tax=Streptosporangium amethystogenes subsp. fukuiense TaxID=698418 RepID=A0ABW2TEN4_9ACTN
MSTELLMEGAEAYTSLAEVAAVPGSDAPGAWPRTSYLTAHICYIAYTIESSC